MGYRLGVDLGTTFTSAAVSRGGTTEPVSLGDHSHEIPSVVYLKPGGGYLVGDAALARDAEQPDRVAREFKRRIGDETSLFLGGAPVPAHVLTGALLENVVGEVSNRQGGPPDEVVVACPANWGPYRRELLQHAMALAGVRDGTLCTEPEAAVLQFASTDRVADGEVVGVYDLGGGTFDAALLRREGAALTFVGRPEGIERLGGLDFDAALFERVVIGLGAEAWDPDEPGLTRGLARLRQECVRAKERLSYDVDTVIPVDLPGAPPTVRVTRGELEEVIEPLIVETVNCLQRVVDHAGMVPEDLSAVILVGGSSRIPLVRELLMQRLGRPLPPSPQPKLSVAMGASLYGDRMRSADAETETIRKPAAPPVAPTAVMPVVRADVAGDAAPSRPARPAPVVAPLPGHHRMEGNERRRGPGRRPLVYGSAGGVLVVAGAILPFALMHRPPQDATQLTWDDDAVLTEPWVATKATLLPADGWELEKPLNASGDQFQLTEALYAGPMKVRLTTKHKGNKDCYVAPARQFLNVPAVAAFFALLYAIAYGETLLRGIRRRRGSLRAGEIVGMTGVGAILGAVTVVASWMSGRLLESWGVVAGVLLLGAAGGALAFAVAARAASRAERASRSLPRPQA